jgi:hypothetical protein
MLRMRLERDVLAGLRRPNPTAIPLSGERSLSRADTTMPLDMDRILQQLAAVAPGRSNPIAT